MNNNKTQLVQDTCGNPTAALALLQRGSADRRTIVVVPNARWCCSCYMTIPSGVYAIEQRCGRDVSEGLADPGFQCKPYFYQVQYCVTQQACTYNAPVKSCPTADDVMVDCNLTLVFSIGVDQTGNPSAPLVKKFVYNLGALRFNEFLAAATDEGIRQLVRVTPLTEVYELRGSNQTGIRNVLRVLNQKFAPFGVRFTKAAITDVHMGELASILQGTTEFKAKITEADKEHDHNMKLINYKADQRLKEMDKLYDRKLQDVGADCKVALLNRDRKIVDAENVRKVATVKAKETAAVELKRAQANYKVATQQGKEENEKLLGGVKAEFQSVKIKTDMEMKVKVQESVEMIKAAENNARALETKANAEGKAAAQMKIVREYNLQMAQLEVAEGFARQGKIVVSGDNGDRLIASMLNPDVLGTIKLGKSG